MEGYEIHMGQTTRIADAPAVLSIRQRGQQPCAVEDGCVRANGRVWGCYIHGLFNNQALRWAWLRTLGWRGPTTPHVDPYDRLADAVEAHLDSDHLTQLLAR